MNRLLNLIRHITRPVIGMMRKLGCSHVWSYDGDTLGGIWLRCDRCEQIDEFLPGCHEPEGGEQVWQDHLRRPQS